MVNPDAKQVTPTRAALGGSLAGQLSLPDVDRHVCQPYRKPRAAASVQFSIHVVIEPTHGTVVSQLANRMQKKRAAA